MPNERMQRQIATLLDRMETAVVDGKWSCSPRSTMCCVTRARPTRRGSRSWGPVDLQRHARQAHGFFTLLMLPGSELGFQQVVKAVRACIVRQSKAQRAAIALTACATSHGVSTRE